jgi:hypothetical protein
MLLDKLSKKQNKRNCLKVYMFGDFVPRKADGHIKVMGLEIPVELSEDGKAAYCGFNQVHVARICGESCETDATGSILDTDVNHQYVIACKVAETIKSRNYKNEGVRIFGHKQRSAA